MAKRLFASKQVTYTELNIDDNSRLRAEMLRRSQRRTVPQIYIGSVHVGGFDDLLALNQAKKLDDLLDRPGCR